ncbi:MAG: hypothetical protein HYW48_12270 [Deltaproteobacteria bacterium]|nr:hypothetical protein [Deltaproteobacteria bacterium]
MRQHNSNHYRLLAEIKSRIGRDFTWFPFVGLLAFGLLLVLTGHLLPKLNVRWGSPATLIELAGPPSPEGAIWFSLSVRDEFVIATTEDRTVLHWHVDAQTTEALGELRNYLKERQKSIFLATALAKRVSVSEPLVIISADSSLKYKHVRPVIYLLAQLGFSHYAFETKQPLS